LVSGENAKGGDPCAAFTTAATCSGTCIHCKGTGVNYCVSPSTESCNYDSTTSVACGNQETGSCVWGTSCSCPGPYKATTTPCGLNVCQ
jgi:hypothetical protein